MLAGPHEFLPQSEFDDVPSLVFAPGLIDAYELLDYNRVYISPEEEKWLLEFGKQELPASFKTVGSEPVSEILEIDGVRVGLVAFPIPPQFFKPTQKDYDQIVQAARSLQGRADIIVGVSCWGRNREALYLQNAEPVLDVLLGSGPGSGMRGRLEAGGKTFWVRSLTKGKYMLLVDVAQLPGSQQQEGRMWRIPEMIRDDFVDLGARIPGDPEVHSLFKGL